MNIFGRQFCVVYDWRVMYSINVLIAIGMVIFGSYLYFSNRPIPNPEIVIVREILNPIIRTANGENLKVKVTVQRTAECPTVVHRLVIDDRGVVRSNSITPGLFTGRIGNNLTVITEVPIPDNLPLGQYKLHSDVVIDCGKRGTFVSSFGDLDFEVVK